MTPSFLGDGKEGERFPIYVSDASPTCFVSISRFASQDEGEGTIGYTFVAPNAPLTEVEEKRLRQFVNKTARVRHRDRLIAPYVQSGMSPAWSYMMHPVARILIQHNGNNRPLTFTPVRDNIVSPYRKPRKKRTTELTTGRALRVSPGEFHGRYGKAIVEARGERIFAHDLEIGVRKDKGPKAIFVDTAKPEIRIFDTCLPESVIASCPGRDLSAIIDHPAFERVSGITAKAISNEDGYVRIEVPMVLEPAGLIPDGILAAWRQ